MSELETPTWLFVFEHEEELIEKAVILTNISGFTARYDLFDFTEGTDLTLTYTGQYYLKVYEQTSPTNLDPDLADKLCHVEEVIVIKDQFTYGVNDPTITRDLYELD